MVEHLLRLFWYVVIVTVFHKAFFHLWEDCNLDSCILFNFSFCGEVRQQTYLANVSDTIPCYFECSWPTQIGDGDA